MNNTPQPSQPVRPPGPTNRLVKLTIELSNTGRTRSNRLRNRTETYVMGLVPSLEINHFIPPADLFTFCCYRALLLGSPATVVRATVQPGRRNVLTDPLSPQPLQGEEAVETYDCSSRRALLFRMQGHRGRCHSSRYFFGFRYSDCRRSPAWLRYQPAEVILDRSTGAPPTFVDEADYQRKVPVLAGGEPPTRAQAWSTWFWLLLHRTFAVYKESGENFLGRWDPDHGIFFRGVSVRTRGR
jgi:hypothetical protein